MGLSLLQKIILRTSDSLKIIKLLDSQISDSQYFYRVQYCTSVSGSVFVNFVPHRRCVLGVSREDPNIYLTPDEENPRKKSCLERE